MFLSGFTLDISDPAVRQCLKDAHDMHRTIMSGFQNEQIKDVRHALNILYRLIEDGDDIRLYVASGTRPDWSGLSRGFAPAKDSPKDITAVLDTLVKGRRLSFDLLAIPSKKEARDGKNSRRVLFKTETERTQWLERKAEQNGFSVLWHREDGQRKAYVPSRPGCAPAVHTGVRFKGELTITDEALFRKAYREGIGAGKAYGMGMLMLSPTGR